MAKPPGSRPGGSTGWPAAADASCDAQWLAGQSSKQEKTSLAPGLAAARKIRKARAGSAKNITPWRETIRSNGACPAATSSASPSTTLTDVAASRPSAILASEGDRSQAMIVASGRACAIARLVEPAPQPTSSARKGLGGAAANMAGSSRSATPASPRSSSVHRSAQTSPLVVAHAGAWFACRLKPARRWSAAAG